VKNDIQGLVHEGFDLTVGFWINQGSSGGGKEARAEGMEPDSCFLESFKVFN